MTKEEKRREYAKKYYLENKEKWPTRYLDKDRKSAYDAEYRVTNRDRKAEYDKAYRAKNTARRLELSNRQRCPIQLSECEYKAALGFYLQSERMNEIFGDSSFQVDHTIPLSKGGLHHPSNLQIVPSGWNRRKGSRHSDRWEVPFKNKSILVLT